MIQNRALPHALEDPSSRRLLLLETDEEGLVGVALHEPGVLEEAGRDLAGTFLVVVGIAVDWHGARVPGTAPTKGEDDMRVSRYLMDRVVSDVLSLPPRGPFIHAIVHKRNRASRGMLKAAGIAVERPFYDQAGQQIGNHLVQIGRLPQQESVSAAAGKSPRQ